MYILRHLKSYTGLYKVKWFIDHDGIKNEARRPLAAKGLVSTQKPNKANSLNIYDWDDNGK